MTVHEYAPVIPRYVQGTALDGGRCVTRQVTSSRPRWRGTGVTGASGVMQARVPTMRDEYAPPLGLRQLPISLGPLDVIAADARVTDITVSADGTVWADRGNGMVQVEASIPLTVHSVRELAVSICAQLGGRLDDACPIADVSAQDGVRVHAVIAPIVPFGATISIRLPSVGAVGLSTLAMRGMWPAAWHGLFELFVRQHANILITGGTGSGKTTMLKALLECCDECERVVAVEEVRELGDCAHTHLISLAERKANVEGAGAIGMSDLVKATLRMRPDRIIVGECRGEEIADLLRALNSGHHGGMTTLHANNIEHVPARLSALGLLAGLDVRATALLAEGAFDVVLHLQRVHGKRIVAQIGMLQVVHEQLIGVTALQWDGECVMARGRAWPAFAQRWCSPLLDDARLLAASNGASNVVRVNSRN